MNARQWAPLPPPDTPFQTIERASMHVSVSECVCLSDDEFATGVISPRGLLLFKAGPRSAPPPPSLNSCPSLARIPHNCPHRFMPIVSSLTRFVSPRSLLFLSSVFVVTVVRYRSCFEVSVCGRGGRGRTNWLAKRATERGSGLVRG